MKAWIYFLQFGKNGPIKIGRTASPKQRIGGFSTPVELRLLGVMSSEDPIVEEKQIHKRLAKSLVRGEWFKRIAALKEMRRHGRRVITDRLQLDSLLQPETLHFRLPMKLRRELEEEAAQRGVSVSKVVVGRFKKHLWGSETATGPVSK